MVIVQEIKNAERYKAHFSVYGDKKTAVTFDYAYRGLLPLVYKYVKGIVCLFYYEEPRELEGCKARIDSIFSAFESCRDTILLLCGKTLQAKEVADALLVNTFTPVNIAENLNVGMDGQAIDSHDARDQEEILYPMLYELRRKGDQFLRAIEKLYKGSEFEYVLEMYKRDTAFRGQAKMHLESQVSKYLLSSGQFEGKFSEAIEEKVSSDDEDDKTYFLAFQLLKRRYVAIKGQYTKNYKNNKFIQVMQQKLESSEDTISPSLQCIVEYFKKIFNGMYVTLDQAVVKKSDFTNKSFWLNPMYFTYTIFLNNLILWSNKMRDAFFHECVANLISDKDVYLASPVDKIAGKEGIFSVFYYLFVQLYHMAAHKTFMDMHWEEMYAKFLLFSNLIQNFCEQNHKGFKRFFCYFKPKLPQDPTFNEKGQTLVFNYYVYLECFANFTKLWKNSDRRLILSDRPEVFGIYKRMFEGITEFCNGPCEDNQKLIYRYRIDIWMAYLQRSVDDVNSDFYALKERCLTYLSSFVEGLEPGITTFMASNINPDVVFNLMISLIKKLALYYRLKESKATQKLVGDYKAKHSFNAAGTLGPMRSTTVPRAGQECDTNTAGENNHSHNIDCDTVDTDHDPEAIITEDHEKAVRFSDPNQILEYYKRYSSFANHVIIEIAQKLLNFMVCLAKPEENRQWKLFLKEKYKKRWQYFRQDLGENDDDNLEEEDYELGNYDDMLETTPEDLVIFHFLLKITMEIEVMEETINAKTKQPFLVSRKTFCIISPICFFLTEDTKKGFKSTMNIENLTSKHVAIVGATDEFLEEMRGNREYFEKYPRIYQYFTVSSLHGVLVFVYFLSLIVNALLLAYYKNSAGQNGNFTFRHRWVEITVDSISIVIAALSFLIIMIWWLTRFGMRRRLSLIKFKKENPHIKKIENTNLFIKIWANFMRPIQDESKFFSFYLHLLFAVLGVYYKPFFHSFHLILLINISDTTRYVAQSITDHLGNLAVTILIALYIIYSFSMLMAQNYSNSFSADEVSDVVLRESMCQSLASCFWYTMDIGLRMGGGIGDTLNRTSHEKTHEFYTRWIFDLGFFFFVNLIL